MQVETWDSASVRSEHEMMGPSFLTPDFPYFKSGNGRSMEFGGARTRASKQQICRSVDVPDPD